jgi:hypothetical protein
MAICQESDHDHEDTPPDDTPETPLDEPRPNEVKDPPPQPDPKGPYVVQPTIRSQNGGE